MNKKMAKALYRRIIDSEPITDITTSSGSSNAASLDLGDVRKDLDIYVDTSGAATLTVEVSKDDSTWRTFDTVDYGSDTESMEQYDIAYQYVRAYLDTATNTVEMSSKGVD